MKEFCDLNVFTSISGAGREQLIKLLVPVYERMNTEHRNIVMCEEELSQEQTDLGIAFDQLLEALGWDGKTPS